MPYYLHELNQKQYFWFNGLKFILLGPFSDRGYARCRRSDGAIQYLHKDIVVVPEWSQASLF